MLFNNNVIFSWHQNCLKKKQIYYLSLSQAYIQWCVYFESFIPNSYKYTLIFTMLQRVFKLCPNFELFYQEIENLKNIFRKNGYPVNFTDFSIRKYLNNYYVKKEVYLLAPKRHLTCVLPFFGKKPLKLRSPLVNSVDKTVRFCNLTVVFPSQR